MIFQERMQDRGIVMIPCPWFSSPSTLPTCGASVTDLSDERSTHPTERMTTWTASTSSKACHPWGHPRESSHSIKISCIPVIRYQRTEANA